MYCTILLYHCKELNVALDIKYNPISYKSAPCRDVALPPYLWNRFVTAEDTNIPLGILFGVQNNRINRGKE